MMIRAYDEVFLGDAMENLGWAVDYAVHGLKMDGQAFLDRFLVSEFSERFEMGDVCVISGMSGIELARKVLTQCGQMLPAYEEYIEFGRSSDFWIGWILAYYQWYVNKSFSVILSCLTYETLDRLYGVLHEADPSKSVEVFDELMRKRQETRLAAYRKALGLSQSQLAAAAGVSVRSIQLYEQRKNDIHHAQYNHLQNLARVLGCRVEDLME
ncbi:MAG: helix-turn-helix transcriptional regulator [Lachnospiraceae bacterium]|nr:helix-turn-helix transcriptional regulator [Lachnospiraceae bacterium]